MADLKTRYIPRLGKHAKDFLDHVSDDTHTYTHTTKVATTRTYKASPLLSSTDSGFERDFLYRRYIHGRPGGAKSRRKCPSTAAAVAAAAVLTSTSTVYWTISIRQQECHKPSVSSER